MFEGIWYVILILFGHFYLTFAFRIISVFIFEDNIRIWYVILIFKVFLGFRAYAYKQKPLGSPSAKFYKERGPAT